MDNATNSMLEFVQSHYLKRKKTNPQYSITAFARDLGLSPSFLSRLLNGKRPLSLKTSVQIATVLNLTQDQTHQLMTAVVLENKKSRSNKKIKDSFERKANELESLKRKTEVLELERFKAMSQWYHLAILNLTYLKNFKPSLRWISNALSIQKTEAAEGIKRLIHLGLLEKKNGTLVKTKNYLMVKTKRSDDAVRAFHKQMIQKAGEALQNTSQNAFNRRYISGTTLAIPEHKIEELRIKLQNIQDEFMQMATSSDATHLYQINLQLFPLNKIEGFGT